MIATEIQDLKSRFERNWSSRDYFVISALFEIALQLAIMNERQDDRQTVALENIAETLLRRD